MLNAYPMPGGVVARMNESRLDAVIAIRFKDALRDIVARHGPRLILDLGRVEFMDSSGLGAILAVRRSLADPRRLEIARLTPNVDRVFRLTRMDTIFTIHTDLPPDAAEAVAASQGPSSAAPTGGPQEGAPPADPAGAEPVEADATGAEGAGGPTPGVKAAGARTVGAKPEGAKANGAKVAQNSTSRDTLLGDAAPPDAPGFDPAKPAPLQADAALDATQDSAEPDARSRGVASGDALSGPASAVGSALIVPDGDGRHG